ncbi:MAG TPA: hypothetical protein VF877_07905 [Gaiellaceae bacterium]
MEGYEVVTPDEDTVGHVVERKGDYLIVEHGLLRKSRHAVPWSTVEIDDAEQKARTSLSKELIATSPKLENGSLDEQAVAAHYGVGADRTAPATEGYGVTEPADPARSAEHDAVSAGLEPGTQDRARIQKEMPRQGPELLDARPTRTDEGDERA